MYGMLYVRYLNIVQVSATVAIWVITTLLILGGKNHCGPFLCQISQSDFQLIYITHHSCGHYSCSLNTEICTYTVHIYHIYLIYMSIPPPPFPSLLWWRPDRRALPNSLQTLQQLPPAVHNLPLCRKKVRGKVSQEISAMHAVSSLNVIVLQASRLTKETPVLHWLSGNNAALGLWQKVLYP